MPSAWVTHVKKFALENNLTYGCALTDERCKATYVKPPRAPRKTSDSKPSPPPPKPSPPPPKPVERVSRIPQPPEKYKSTKLDSSSKIPRLIKKSITETPPPSPPPPKRFGLSPKSFNENLKKIEHIRNNTPNGVFIKKSIAKEILTISFFSKLSLNPDDLIFDEKSNVKYLSKTDISSNYSADRLIKIFKEWYDKNKIAPDTGNNIQRYYRQIPFDDLRFYEF